MAKNHALRIMQKQATKKSVFTSPSIIPGALKSTIRNLRLFGVFSHCANSLVFHSVNKTDCERFIKIAPSVFGGLYIVRFDSVVF